MAKLTVVVFAKQTVNHHVFELSLMEIVLPKATLLLESQPFYKTDYRLVVGEHITGYLIEV